ncbi:hypothetical protein MMC25_000297 [Agyrium rufum]|nr:hypothetical protein [Agyrium rufum]
MSTSRFLPRVSRPSTFSLLSRSQPQSRLLSTTSALSANDWKGRHGDEHVLNQDHEHNVHSAASQQGRKERAAGGTEDVSSGSQATSETDQGNNNERAKKDHPEAPGPVLGMNDERGGKGH